MCLDRIQRLKQAKEAAEAEIDSYRKAVQDKFDHDVNSVQKLFFFYHFAFSWITLLAFLVGGGGMVLKAPELKTLFCASESRFVLQMWPSAHHP